jgi:predicted esterase
MNLPHETKSPLHAHKIAVTKTARYYLTGEIHSGIQEIWWLFHGYGMLARYFIQKFEPYATTGRLFIAPEGLSRFYLSNNYERVGASWVTKDDRLDDISDNLTFLNTLKHQLDEQLAQVGCQPAQIQHRILGFSQGTATAWRWLNQPEPCIQATDLVLWAGSVPHEVEQMTRYTGLRIWGVFGIQDPLIKPEKISEMRAILDTLPHAFYVLTYDGGHQIDSTVLQQLFEKIDKAT